MEERDFSPASPGQLVRNLQGHLSYLPAPLPTRFAWTDSLVKQVALTGQALGELTGLGRKLPNPQRLVRMFLRREAELSSRIEQTHARIRTMLLFEHLPAVADDVPAVREVANNYKALEFSFKSGRETDAVTVALIRRMHEILFDGIEQPQVEAGRFRQIPNFIGHSRDIEDARYVPPPPQEVNRCMTELVDYVRRPGDLPTVVRCALAHYQFEAIHPFIDGNGRVGRALVLLMLNREGVLPVPLLNPSAELERRRREYYDRMLAVTQNGEWSAWVEFFAACVEVEARDACQRLIRLDALRDTYRAKYGAARTSALLLRLIDELFAEPAITTRDAANRLKINSTNAQRLVDKLVAGGLLVEVTGQQRNRVYLAQEMIDVFSTRQTG
jgi:Fic family protein